MIRQEKIILKNGKFSIWSMQKKDKEGKTEGNEQGVYPGSTQMHMPPSSFVCVFWGEREWTLLTRIVPANPLRPAMPRGGGKAQSSPTITVYKVQQ